MKKTIIRLALLLVACGGHTTPEESTPPDASAADIPPCPGYDKLVIPPQSCVRISGGTFNPPSATKCAPQTNLGRACYRSGDTPVVVWISPDTMREDPNVGCTQVDLTGSGGCTWPIGDDQ